MKTTTAIIATRRGSGRQFTKRIGTTTYKVGVHFSETNKETMNDKILRLIRSEATGKAAGQ